MPTLEGSLFSTGMILAFTVSLVLLAGSGWAVWVVSRQLVLRERQVSDALGAVMRATVLRRNQEETLARILATTVESLDASSGALHLADDSGLLQLVHAEGVERFDLIARVPPSDELVRTLSRAADDVLVLPLERDIPVECVVPVWRASDADCRSAWRPGQQPGPDGARLAPPA